MLGLTQRISDEIDNRIGLEIVQRAERQSVQMYVDILQAVSDVAEKHGLYMDHEELTRARAEKWAKEFCEVHERTIQDNILKQFMRHLVPPMQGVGRHGD